MARATCASSILYNGSQASAFDPNDWPGTVSTSTDWGSYGGGIAFPYLLISGQKNGSDSWQSSWLLPVGTSLAGKSFALSVRSDKAFTWSFRLRDRAGNYSGYLSQDIPANAVTRVTLPAASFSGSLDLENIASVQLELLNVAAWSWMNIILDSVALECGGSGGAAAVEYSPQIRLSTTKMQEHANYAQYTVTVRNTGTGPATRPTVAYFASTDALLAAAIDYSNPSGVLAQVVSASAGYRRVLYTLPGDLGAGQQVVFHTRIYRSDWANRNFSVDWSNQGTVGVDQPNPLWTVRSASDSLLYGNDPVTLERQSDVVVWYGADGPQAVQPYVTGDVSPVAAPRLWLLANDPLTAKELKNLAALGLRRLEGQTYQDHSLYLLHQTGQVSRAQLDQAVSGFYNVWAVDTVHKDFQRASNPLGDTTHVYHIEARCWPDLTMDQCVALARQCGASNAQRDHNTVLADIPKSAVACLLQQGGLRTLGEQGQGLPLNNTARIASNLEPLQITAWGNQLATFPPTENWLKDLPYTGKGIVVGVYDSGLDTAHWDFKEVNAQGDTIKRLATKNEIHSSNPQLILDNIKVYKEGADEYNSHGTHVAGIIGGNGWRSNSKSLRGVAPKVHFYSYGGAHNRQVGHVVNHSHTDEQSNNYYGNSEGNAGSIDYNIFYNKDATSTAGDTLTKTFVWAAANNGGSSPQYGSQRGYHSILINAKNPIVVGNYASQTGARISTSSMGPTWDGRIKPEVMAPGSRYEYGNTASRPMTFYIDYVRLYRAGQTTPYWQDDFNLLSTIIAVGGSVSIVQDGNVASALKFIDTNSSGAYFLSSMRSAQLSLLPTDEFEISLRAEFLGNKTDSLGGHIMFGLDYNIADGAPIKTMRWPLDNDGRYRVSRFPLGLRFNPLYYQLAFYHGLGILSTAASEYASSYRDMTGTSQAAPHVTGIVALMLQKYRETTGIPLEQKTLRNSTSKAMLIHTATDMVDSVGLTAGSNPDLDATMADGLRHPVRYYPGPDYATGWGKVNGAAVLAMVDTTRFQEVPVAYGEDLTWTFKVPKGQKRLRVTTAWDDAPIFMSDEAAVASYLDNKLVNDLDLALVSPSGTIHYPWRLARLPVGTYTYDRLKPLFWRLSGLEPIQEKDIAPAVRNCPSGVDYDADCFDHLNNVEVVDVDAPEAGQWTVRLRGTRIMQGNSADSLAQMVSIVADYPLGKPSRGNAHPYAAHSDASFTYALGNNLVSQVTFTDQTCLGTGDTLKLYDVTRRLIGSYTGCQLAGATVEVVGSTLTVQLLSDGSSQGYGFAIANMNGLAPSLLPLLWEATKKAK